MSRTCAKVVFATRSSPQETVVGLGGSTVATKPTSNPGKFTSDDFGADWLSAGDWKSPEVRETSNESSEISSLLEQIKRLSTNVGARPSSSRSMWDLPHGTSAFAQLDPNANTSRYRGGETLSPSPYGVEDRPQVRSSSWLSGQNPRLGVPIAPHFVTKEIRRSRRIVEMSFRKRIYLFAGNTADFPTSNPGLRN